MFFLLWLSQPPQFKFLPEFYFPPDLLFEHHIHHQRQCWLTISSPVITFTSLTLLLYLLFKYTTNPHTNTQDILCSKIYLTELENQTMEAKMTELKNWGKKQEVYRDEEDRRQLCISVRSVFSQKVKMVKTSPKQDFVQGVSRRSKTSPLTLHVAQESVFARSLL